MSDVMGIRARVTGRVQGVGYRAWARDRGAALGLSGWARNEADGSVTVVAHGPERAVRELIRALGDGPTFARVAGVETSAEADVPEPGFAIRRRG